MSNPSANSTPANRPRVSTRKLTAMGLMAAVSVMLVAVVHFPIFPAAPFLEYDPADISIFICTFLYGPVSGLLLTLVVSVIQGLTVSAASGPIGIIMHIFATGTFVLVSGNIYRVKRTRGGAVMALAAGVAVWVLAMCVWNLIFTPIFMGTPRAAVMEILLPVIVPFNFIKAGINSVITFAIYKSIAKLVRSEE